MVGGGGGGQRPDCWVVGKGRSGLGFFEGSKRPETGSALLLFSRGPNPKR